MDKSDELLKKDILTKNNKKVKEQTLKRYLKSFDLDELIRFLTPKVFVDEETGNISDMEMININSKKNLINYITNNLEDILKCFIEKTRTEEVNQLKFILENNNKDLLFDECPLSLNFINDLKILCFTKVYYNNKKDLIKFFMPIEFIEIFNKILKDKEVLEKNKYYNDIYDYTESIINTYGIITLTKLLELFEKQMFKIEEEKLINIVNLSLSYDKLIFHPSEEDVLVCNLEFSNEDAAEEFYKDQTEDYKVYSKEEYKKISSYDYLYKLKSYNELKNYFSNNYKTIEIDFEKFKKSIVTNYINIAQVSIDSANEFFKIHIKYFIEVDNEKEDYILKLVNDIFENYPKWRKRGNV